MRGVVMHAPGDVRVEDLPEPTIQRPTDAIIRLAAACVCGSDLWPYRGADEISEPKPMGHEYVGIVEQVGEEVTSIKVGDFVVGSFFASDNTCEICRAGYQTNCLHADFPGPSQAQVMRVPLADGTLVATPGQPDPDLIPSLLAASDVLGTGWFGAVAAEAGPGKTVAVVGDGAVGLLAVLAAKELGRSGSSRCRGMPIGRRWPGSSVPPTSLRNAARRASRRRNSLTDSGALRGRGGRYARVDDAGHRRHPTRRPRRVRRRPARRRDRR